MCHLDFSDCSEEQKTYHEISTKALEPAFKKLKNILMETHSKCSKEKAWKENNQLKFIACTEQIINRSWVEQVFADIKKFAVNQYNSTPSAEIQIGQALEDAYKTASKSNGLDLATAYIRDHSGSAVSDNACSLLPGCLSTVRKIVLQLKMIDLGIFGLADSLPGAFLAYHYSTIGPYFGTNDGHEWPQNPLGKDPTLIEKKLNKQLIEMTKILSRGNVSNVSILDFPAFGSKIGRLDKKHKRESNWPTEINFEVLKVSKNSLPSAFREYKILLSHWENYMYQVFKKNPYARFTPEMEKNQHLNLTKYIRSDMETFLLTLHGSLLTASEKEHPAWKQVAEKLFNGTVDNSKKGIYDKLIMECDYGIKNLFTKSPFNHNGGCDLFKPILTTNGHCYTFNAKESSIVWKDSEVVKQFSSLFPWNQEIQNFRGAVSGDGEHLKFLLLSIL